MKIDAARFTADALELVVDGRPAWSDTKRSLLDAGIAVLQDPGDAEAYWDHATSATLPAGDDLAQPLIIPGGTRDPSVVALARRYWQAVNTADFVEGDVAVA